MGVKLYNTHKDFLQQEWKIEVIDTSFSGTPTEFKNGPSGAVIEWDGEDRNIITDGLRPSICSFDIIVSAQDTALNTYLESVVLYNEQKLFLNIYKKVSGTFTLVWKGLINQTGFEFPDEADYTFTMTANDGFAKLKDQTFDYVLTAGENITLMEAITKALSYNGLFDEVGTLDNWVSSTLDLYARNQRTTRDVLFDSRIRRESFYEDLDSLTPLTCYEVIERILKSFGAQMKMWDGRFYIFRAVDLRLSSINVKNYTKTGAYINTTTIAPALTFPVADTRYAFNPIQYTFDQAYKQVNVNWNAVSKFVSQKVVPVPFNLDYVTVSIEDDGVAKCNYKMNSDVNIYRVTQRGQASAGTGTAVNSARQGQPPEQEFFYTIYYEIKSGNYYLKLLPSGAKWVLNPADRSVSFTAKANLSPLTKTNNELFFPPPPAGSTQISVRLSTVYYMNTVICNFNAKVTLQQQVNSPIGQNPLTFVEDSSEPKYEDVKKVYQDNVNSGSLNLVNTTDIAISDEPFLAQNCLRVYNGTSWLVPNQWKQGTDTEVLPFTKMYARELMRAYKNPLYKCTGVFFMDVSFFVMKTITWRGRVLFFNAGKFSTAINEWDGEFVQISYNTNARPISATKPNVSNIDRKLGNEIALIKQQIQSISASVDGLSNSMLKVVNDVNTINQTRSQNADKYLIDHVEGIPENGADVGAQYPLKAEVTATGVKLKFFSS